MNKTKSVDTLETAVAHSRYDEYRDSEVDWLGEIPAHWDCVKLKWLLSRNESGVWGDEPDSGEESTVVLRSTDQTVDGEWRINDPAERKLGKEEVEYALLEEGDLLVTTSSGSEKHLGKTSYVNSHVAEIGACFSNFMQRLRTRQKFNPKYLYWILNCPIGRRQFNYYGSSTTGLANLNSTVISRLDIPLPSQEEQSIIAAFLDRETGRIDALIEKKERLIDLLEEKRTALISRVVTKGLDRDVEMQDSSVEWLGRIPSGWEIVPLKYISDIETSGTWGEDLDETFGEKSRELPVARVSDIGWNGEVIHEDMPSRKLTESEAERYSCQPGDILVVKASGSAKNIITGRTAQVQSDKDFAFGNFLLRLRAGKDVNERFLFHFVSSSWVQQEIERMVATTTYPNLKVDEYRSFAVPLPTVEKQKKIAAYVDRRISEVDQLIDRAEEGIKRLKEYRTALISAAVTGQIDVGEEVGMATVE